MNEEMMRHIREYISIHRGRMAASINVSDIIHGFGTGDGVVNLTIEDLEWLVGYAEDLLDLAR